MNRNKLLHIIQKDLDELQEIADEMTGKSQLSGHEIEFALGKARIIWQEFDYLKELNQQPHRPEPQGPPKASPSFKQFLENKASGEQDGEPANTTGEPVVAGPGQHTGADRSAANETTGDARREDTAEPSAPRKTVAEIFVQEKSLNDLLPPGKTIDHQLSGTPLASLEAAIGLNDRFQFIRELFSHDPGLFNETVKEIDQLENLPQAVAYLNSHFKWKKNETSMKFAQLVKRRFSD